MKRILFAGFVFFVAASSYGQHGHGIGLNDPPKWKIQLRAEGTTTGLRRLAGVPYLAFETDLVSWDRFCPTAWYDGLTGAGIAFSYADTLREGDNSWDNHALGVASVGAFRAILAWHPGEEGALPPTKLYYRLTANADSGNMGGQVQNGLGSPSNYSPFLLGYAANGSKMFKAELGGASQFLTPALSVNAAASNSSALGSPRASVSFSIQVLEPPYIVSGFETSYYRVGSERTARKRDSNLELVVDSVATWDNEQQKWVGQARLEAKQSMWEMAKAEWTWTNAEIVSTEVAQGGNIYGGPTAITIRSKFPATTGKVLDQESTATLKTNDWTENENLESENGYTIRWHMPYENWIEFRPSTFFWRQPLAQDGQPSEGAGDGGIYSFRWNEISPRWGNFVDEFPNYMGSVADIIPIPFIQILAATLGFFVSHMDNHWVQEGATFNEHWGSQGSTYIPSKIDSLRNRYRMTAEVWLGMKHYFLDAEQYDSYGYMNQKRMTVDARDARKETHGRFILQDSEIPGPNGGGI